MIHCKEFDASVDLEKINEWMRERGEREYIADELPRFGFIVEDTVAGFLYLTDSSVAFMESFVSNPNASARDVSKGFNMVVEKLTDFCVSTGRTKILGFSSKKSVIGRMQKLGFTKSPKMYEFIGLEVG